MAKRSRRDFKCTLQNLLNPMITCRCRKPRGTLGSWQLPKEGRDMNEPPPAGVRHGDSSAGSTGSIRGRASSRYSSGLALFVEMRVKEHPGTKCLPARQSLPLLRQLRCLRACSMTRSKTANNSKLEDYAISRDATSEILRGRVTTFERVK
jgi:hypothetical protein